MSKSALNRAGRSVAVDRRPGGMFVVLLHPSYVATAPRLVIVAASSPPCPRRASSGVVALNARRLGRSSTFDRAGCPSLHGRNNNACRHRDAARYDQEQSRASSDTKLRERWGPRSSASPEAAIPLDGGGRLLREHVGP